MLRLYDVAVIGAGPVGATAAILLAAAGLDVVVIERDPVPHALPRAVHIDHEIMRIFQSVGLAQRLEPLMRATQGHLHIGADGEVLRYMGTAGETARFGWANDYFFYQPELEAVLRDALGATPGVTTRMGSAFTAVVQTTDNVCIELSTGDSVSARYAIGCDGAASPVRKALGIALIDLDFEEPWLVVDAEVDGRLVFPDYAGLPPQADLQQLSVMLCDPSRPATVVPGRGNHRRWEFMLLPGESDEAMRDPVTAAALIEPWVQGVSHRLIRAATYRFHGLIAAHWQAGRVFLAGDAAHQTPPFFGQGMCHGIRDVANIAWKMKLVIDGIVPPSLLRSYQIEREPQVRSVIAAAVEAGRYICELDHAAAGARDREIRAREALGRPRTAAELIVAITGIVRDGDAAAGIRFIQPRINETLLDDLTGGGFALLTRPGFAMDVPSDFDDVGGAIYAIDAPALAPWFDEFDTDAVLVRPDFYVFGTAKFDGVSALIEDLLVHIGQRAQPQFLEAG